MAYGWVVTKDNMFDPDLGLPNRTGTAGPRRIPPEILAALRGGEGTRWRALDDDNNVVYEGRYIGPMDESAFGPLEDFAMPDAGCTRIDYWKPGKGGGWETL